MNRLTPRKALNKAYLKAPIQRPDLIRFADKFKELISKINPNESEEHNKNNIADFLKNAFYSPNYYINTVDRIDLAIHIGNSSIAPVGVIIETKKTGNVFEMPRADTLNVKGMQELVLYYLRERISKNNLELKHLILTDLTHWYLFDAHEFEKAFAENSKLVSMFRQFETGALAGATTEFFYKEIADPAIADIQDDLTFTYFEISDISSALKAVENSPTKALSFLKLLSPQHLLKLPFSNDSNRLNKNFYDELLHIIGLAESKEDGKRIIARLKEENRHSGSLIENAIAQVLALDKLRHIPQLAQYGKNKDEQLFAIGLELCLSWINRILFLKLLEAQLIRYHRGKMNYAFLSNAVIKGFDDVDALFFQVLAEPVISRSKHIADRFPNIPYLNSSLFEITDIERNAVTIGNLSDDLELPIAKRSVLKTADGKRRIGTLKTLAYLFEFLDAYDFASEGGDEVQDSSRALINSSVLGLIFEKINGYKDGSYFTPGLITMHMARISLRQAIVNKFNTEKNWQCETFTDLYNAIKDADEANKIINDIRICDPAVGSGHFLVSALNELIAVKFELGIFRDKEGRRLRGFSADVLNDELVITDDEGEIYNYNPKNHDSQRVQEALFEEKRRLIEGSLFGVDINPNSVNICRLRLWIELLKHSFYKADGQLETLPNIDINIKCGNSLISKFPIDSDIGPHLKQNNTSIAQYREAVFSYKNATSKDQKLQMFDLIERFKANLGEQIQYHHPLSKKVELLKAEIKVLELPQSLFEETAQVKKARLAKRKKKQEELTKADENLSKLKSNAVFSNSFEWRLEFPEVLRDDGHFEGFDVVIGNPPYISAIGLKKILNELQYQHLKDNFSVAKGAVDLYVYFFELATRITKKEASLCYICPNRYLSANYAIALREHLLSEYKFSEISDYSKVDVFEEAQTYPLVSLFSKPRPNNYTVKVFSYTEDQVLSERQFNSSILGVGDEKLLGFLLSDKYEITNKVMSQSVNMLKVGLVNATSTAAEADNFSSHISDTTGDLKLINTGTIDRYSTTWGISELKDKGKKYLKPYLPRSEAVIGTRRLALYSSPKILFAKIALRTEAFFDESGEYASINTNCIHSFKAGFEPLYVLGWLNSKLFQYMRRDPQF